MWIWILGLGIPLLAAAVPIIIHLINLTRYRKVDWAAMEFLLRAYERTRRKMQVENLIMLLLRVAAVMLIAMALFPMACSEVRDWAGDKLGMARGTLTTDAPLHLVIVLDNSASMSYESENQSAFDRGKQFALAVVDSLRPGRDRVSIVRMSDVYVPPGLGGIDVTDTEAEQSRRRRLGQLSGLGLDAARREISATGVAAVDTNVLIAFREVERLVKGTPETDAAGVVVISDFYNSGWGQVRKDASGHRDFSESFDAINARLKDSGTSMTFYDAGHYWPQNIAIMDVRVGERIIGADMEANVFIDLAYFTTSAREERKTVRLKYRVDGGTEKPFAEPIELAPGAWRLNIPLTLSPRELELKEDELKTGASRNIEIFTEQADGLRMDNARNLVIHVVPSIPILVVNGSPHADVQRDETFYLETALGISTNRIEGETPGELMRITPNRVITMNATQLASVDTFLDYRLVVLANVRDVNEGTAKKLTEFVEAGFGLVIFDGDQVDFQKYNSLLYDDGRGLLPARLGSTAGNPDKITAPHYALAPGKRDHPVIALFMESDETVSIITNPTAIRNWRSVKMPEGAEVDPLRPTEVLLDVNAPGGKQPLMLERPFGRGRVVYVGTSASETWNSLWESGNGLPLFLYLELASYLTANEARFSNLSVGQPYRRVLRVTDIAPQYTIRDPSGVISELASTSAEGVGLLEFGGTAAPGVYALTALDRMEGGETRRKWQERFAVNMDARESDVSKMAPVDTASTAQPGTQQMVDVNAALVESLGTEDFLFVRAGDEIGSGGPLGGEDGKQDWMWLAALGIAFLMFEPLWSGVISKAED